MGNNNMNKILVSKGKIISDSNGVKIDGNQDRSGSCLA